MTKKIIAFGASNSSTSINKRLATYASTLFKNTEVEILDLNNYEMPIFSVDKEANGFPKEAQKFLDKIQEADLLVVSMAEHNGNYTTAFKNILDWTSRINGKVFQGKKMLLMATSPGARGGKSVLEISKDRFPRHDADLVGTFSLPSFYENFDSVNGIINIDLKNELLEIIKEIDF
ncbi:NAD(P)H-dependent oxidoreductase [Flavobacterium jejuense]|uniref:NAD(P)H-dependent oxidoreductase n=1 Tax=Flavobacterium jejuense TaxID=1544455 RepID=A0ABX0IX72_9FLAO|nr:NAD(P)H-dependent oxidoreductase [Flavobacterium jejuense]NHN26394.1 NAD(P)H-dependent oxidoreductase [Flavobacterium jejuense]